MICQNVFITRDYIMNFALTCIIAIICGSRAPVTKVIPWRAACDGAEIEVVSEGPLLRSIRASAIHSLITAEWTVHFVDGVAATAEYRESSRGRILEGERAGDYTGIDRVMKLETWKAEKEGFQIPDEARAKELREVLALAAQGNAPLAR